VAGDELAADCPPERRSDGDRRRELPGFPVGISPAVGWPTAEGTILSRYGCDEGDGGAGRDGAGPDAAGKEQARSAKARADENRVDREAPG